MKIQEDKDESHRKRSLRDDEEEQDFLQEQQARILAQLKPGYSWIKHFQTMHPGWDFLHYEEIPWTPIKKDLSLCKVAYLSFAGVFRKGQKPFNVSAGAVPEHWRRLRFKFPGDASFREIPRETTSSELLITHTHFDHSDADEDINCVFPLDRLQELNEENFFESLCSRHYSFMGYSPDWEPIAKGHAIAVGDQLLREGVDVAFLSPGCLLSHQNLAIVQRHLESIGIVTVSITLCSDITLQIGTPRSLSLRFPFGNVFGASQDAMTQSRIVQDVLSSLEEFEEPGEIIELPYDWTVIPS